jgi:hypothetical protein
MRAKALEIREDHVKRILMQAIARVTRRLWAVLFTKDFEYSELQNGAVMIMWGGWMLCFASTDQAFAAAIGVMNMLAPEGLWAGMFILIGMLKLYGLLWEVMFARRAASMLAFVYWFFIFLTLVTTSPYLFAVPVTLILSLSAVWGHIRLAAQH